MSVRIWFLVSLLACAISYSYRHKVLAPWEDFLNVQRGELKAQMGDLYSRWIGTRELLLHGRNPYGEEVSHEIQNGFYGHAIEQNYAQSRVVDEQRFAYPIYVVLFLAPSVHSEFETVRVAATFVLAALTVVSIPLWMGVLRWRPPLLHAATITLFVLSSPQLVQGLRLQQLGLLVGFLVALASWCVTRGYYAIAGGLLAFATIKPQMVVLCIVWYLIWSLGDWSKRWPLVIGFAVTLSSLVGLGEVLVRGWVGYFLAGIAAYRKYVPAMSPMRIALGQSAGAALSIVMMAAVVAFAWNQRRLSADSNESLRALAIVFIVTLLVFPLLPIFNQVLVLLPLLMLIRGWRSRSRLSRVLFTIVFAWPWVISLVFLLHRPQVASLSPLPLLPSLLAPFVPLLFLMSFARTRHNTPLARPPVAL